jgi:hypothetical protein
MDLKCALGTELAASLVQHAAVSYRHMISCLRRACVRSVSKADRRNFGTHSSRRQGIRSRNRKRWHGWTSEESGLDGRVSSWRSLTRRCTHGITVRSDQHDASTSCLQATKLEVMPTIMLDWMSPVMNSQQGSRTPLANGVRGGSER